MDEEQVKKIILDNQTENQYNVSPIPAHVHNGVDSLLIDFSNIVNRTRFVLYRAVSPTVYMAVANEVGGKLVMPFNGFITEVGTTVDTAGATGLTTIDINNGGNTIMITKITIDSGEFTSRTAATPSIINPVFKTFKIGDVLTFDVDTISATPPLGLTMFINVTQI